MNQASDPIKGMIGLRRLLVAQRLDWIRLRRAHRRNLPLVESIMAAIKIRRGIPLALSGCRKAPRPSPPKFQTPARRAHTAAGAAVFGRESSLPARAANHT